MKRSAVAQQNEVAVEQGPPGYVAISEFHDGRPVKTIQVPSNRVHALIHCLKAAKRDNDRDF